MLLINPEDEISNIFILFLLLSHVKKPFQIARYVYIKEKREKKELKFLADELPSFYAALLKAWKAFNGSVSLNGSFADKVDYQVSSFSCKSCNQLSLLINLYRPHCVDKFRLSFGDLDLAST